MSVKYCPMDEYVSMSIRELLGQVPRPPEDDVSPAQICRALNIPPDKFLAVQQNRAAIGAREPGRYVPPDRNFYPGSRETSDSPRRNEKAPAGGEVPKSGVPNYSGGSRGDVVGLPHGGARSSHGEGTPRLADSPRADYYDDDEAMAAKKLTPDELSICKGLDCAPSMFLRAKMRRKR